MVKIEDRFITLAFCAIYFSPNRMGEFNRHLLYPYKMDSGQNFKHFWPHYDMKNVTEDFREKHWAGLSTIPGYLSSI